MAKRNGNRELKKPKQIKTKTEGAMSVSELANTRKPVVGGRRK